MSALRVKAVSQGAGRRGSVVDLLAAAAAVQAIRSGSIT